METSNIDVIILCGGPGKRLEKAVSDRPKPMAEVKKKPFMDILIDYIAAFGLRRFILSTGHKSDFIKEYYRNKETSMEILFCDEKESLGTGGAVKRARPLVQSSPFLVVNGDSICKVDIGEFVDFHKQKGALTSMVLTRSDKRSDTGTVKLDSSKKVISFSEKDTKSGKRNLTNAGIYLFEKEIFSLMPYEKSFSLEKDIFPIIVGENFYGYLTEQNLFDIGTPERYKAAQELIGVGE